MSSDILQGIGVLVTRPAAQCGELTSAIEAAGGYAFQLPALTINPRNPDAIKRDLDRFPSPDIVIYASRNAVLQGAALLGAYTTDDTKVAAIGPATRDALAHAGLVTDIQPASGFDSEHLLLHDELQQVHNKTIFIVRGNDGRELLADTLRSRGAAVECLAVYERLTASPDEKVLAELQSEWHSGRIRVVIVMSVDSLTSLMKIIPDDCQSLLEQSLLVTPSNRVLQTAMEMLPDSRSMLADGIQVEHLVKAIVRGQHACHDARTQ